MFKTVNVALDPAIPPAPAALKHICFFICDVLHGDYHLLNPAVSCHLMPPGLIETAAEDEEEAMPRYGVMFYPEDEVDPRAGCHVDSFLDDFESAFNDICEHPRSSLLNGSVSFGESGDTLCVSNLEDIVTILERLSEMKTHYWHLPRHTYTIGDLNVIVDAHYKNGDDSVKPGGSFGPDKIASTPVFNQLAMRRADQTEKPLTQTFAEEVDTESPMDETDLINLWAETFIEEALSADYKITIPHVSVFNHSKTGRVLVKIGYREGDDPKKNLHDRDALEKFLLHLTDARLKIRQREHQGNGGPVELRIDVDEKSRFMMARSLDDVLDILTVLSQEQSWDWDKPAYRSKGAPLSENFILTDALRLQAEVILAVKPELLDSINATDGFLCKDDMLKEILRFNALLKMDAGPLRTHTLDEFQRAIETYNAETGSTKQPYYQTNLYGYAQ